MKIYSYLIVICCLLLLFQSCESTGPAHEASDIEALLQAGDPETALQLADARIDADPLDLEAVYLAAKALHELGDYKQSNFYLGEFLEGETTHAEGFYLRGLNFRGLGNAPDARSAFSSALKYAPRNGEAREFLLGYAYEDHNWSLWWEHLRKLEEMGSQGSKLGGMVAIRAMTIGNYEAAIAMVDSIKMANPNEGVGWFKARILLEQGRPQAALEALSGKPENPFLGGGADYLKAWAFNQLEKFDSVEVYIERLREYGRVERADQAEVMMLVRQGYPKDAIRLLNHSELNYTLCSGWGDYIEAFYDQSVVSKRPFTGKMENKFLHEARCWRAYPDIIWGGDDDPEGKRIESGVSDIEMVLSQNPQFPLAHWMMGWIHLKKGSLSEACTSFEKAKSLNIEMLYGKDIIESLPSECQ